MTNLTSQFCWGSKLIAWYNRGLSRHDIAGTRLVMVVLQFEGAMHSLDMIQLYDPTQPPGPFDPVDNSARSYSIYGQLCSGLLRKVTIQVEIWVGYSMINRPQQSNSIYLKKYQQNPLVWFFKDYNCLLDFLFLLIIYHIFLLTQFFIKPYVPREPQRNSSNRRFHEHLSETTRTRTRNPFHNKRVPIPLWPQWRARIKTSTWLILIVINQPIFRVMHVSLRYITLIELRSIALH